MIIPCMNSTSAADRGGSTARVDDDNVLLGIPGAPGCTTTGLAGSDCWPPAAQQKTTAETLMASDNRGPQCVVRGKIFILMRMASFHKIVNVQGQELFYRPRTAEDGCPQIRFF